MNKKTCPKCKKPKALTDTYWHHDASKANGWDTRMCKVCKNRQQKYRREHPEWLELEDLPPDDFDEAVVTNRAIRLIEDKITSIYKAIV